MSRVDESTLNVLQISSHTERIFTLIKWYMNGEFSLKFLQTLMINANWTNNDMVRVHQAI